ncbi:hypothetical protein BDZ89DRAFT_934380, partial [Hymenopellis radicata]
MAKAFATTTGGEFAVYYSYDTVGTGSRRMALAGQNALDAWNMSPKYNAHDLAGRLPLTIGMPIIVVDNVAVELGLCNSSPGTLVNIQYLVNRGKRYAVSVELDVPRYTSPDKHAPHPNRVLVPLTHFPLTYQSTTN